MHALSLVTFCFSHDKLCLGRDHEKHFTGPSVSFDGRSFLMKQFFAILAILGLITTSVSSQQPGNKKDSPPRGERGHRPPGERDHDRGGPHQQGPPPHDPIFMLFDTDRNGELSQKEMEQATEILKNRDKNENGVLSRDEIPRPPRPPHRRGGGPPHQRADRPHHPRGEQPPHRRGGDPTQQRAERSHHPRGERSPHRRGEGPTQQRSERSHHPRGEQPPRERGEHPPRERGERPPRERGEHPPRERGEHPPRERGEHPPRERGEHPPRERGERPPHQREGREIPPRTREPQAQGTENAPAGSLIFTGGYETDPRDHGRPVKLIAAALGVKSEVFREAFSNVKPARGGDPTPARANANKKVLMDALGKHGITNDRLDTVSNYYRYQPGRGNLWKHTPASAKAIIKEGKVTGFEITNPGSGYMTPPSISVVGHEKTQVKATLQFTKNFQTNGSIESLTIVE